MKKWLSRFGPGLRLLAVFGIGAAGVTAVLPPGESPPREPTPEPGVTLARLAVELTESTPTAMPVADAASYIPWPWLDDLSQVELSEALLADLSRAEISQARTRPNNTPQGSAGTATVVNPNDPLFTAETALPLTRTARFPGDAVEARGAIDELLVASGASGY